MKEAICELLGCHIAKRRLDRGFSQSLLAASAGISRQALSAIERGEQAPAWETIYALADVLRCEVWDLVPSVKQVSRR